MWSSCQPGEVWVGPGAGTPRLAGQLWRGKLELTGPDSLYPAEKQDATSLRRSGRKSNLYWQASGRYIASNMVFWPPISSSEKVLLVRHRAIIQQMCFHYKNLERRYSILNADLIKYAPYICMSVLYTQLTDVHQQVQILLLSGHGRAASRG